MSEQCLEDTGLTGTPRIEGKREGYADSSRAIKRLEDLRTSYGQEADDINCLTGILLTEAHQLAQDDLNFDADYFKPYLRVLKRTRRKTARCKHLQSVYLLPDGRLFLTEQGYNLPNLDGCGL